MKQIQYLGIQSLSCLVAKILEIKESLITAINTKANQSDFNSHTSNTSNPHNVTAKQIGLENVNNTSDINKPISTATQQELDKKIESVTLSSGTNNGTLKITVDGVSTDNVAVKGLGTAAYTSSDAYASAGHKHSISDINSGSITIGNKSKTLTGNNLSWTLNEIGADPLITGYYGSDTANTAGWYKVCTVSQTGYSDYSLNLMITSGYGSINSGVLHLHTRCDNGTTITVKAIKWLVRYGWESDNAIIVTGNNTWSLYIYRSTSQHGRIQVKVLSKAGTTSDTELKLENNTVVETVAPSGTASTDGGIVYSAEKLTSSAGSATQPIYFSGGKPVATTYTLEKSVPSDAKFTDTTYSANNGISLSGTTFSNSGVRSISTGTANGTISVNTNGTSANVSVKGLGSAAYTASSAYLGSSGNQTLTDGAIIIPNATTSYSFRATRTVDNVVSQADLYISENGNPRLRFNYDGSTANYLSLQSDSTVFGKPVAISSGGTGATTKADARSNLGITCKSLYSGTLKSGSCSFAYGDYKAYVVVGKPSTESFGIVSLFIPASYITTKRTMQLADNLYYFLFDIIGSGSTCTITIGTNNNNGHIAQVYGVN